MMAFVYLIMLGVGLAMGHEVATTPMRTPPEWFVRMTPAEQIEWLKVHDLNHHARHDLGRDECGEGLARR